MAHKKAPTKDTLSAAITGPAELARLQRELDDFIDATHQSMLRTKAGHKANAPSPTKKLSGVAADFSLDVTAPKDADALRQILQETSESAPQLTVSFAVEPSSAFIAKLVTWMRSEIHPQLLVRVGLQPDIAAGCIVQTSSKVYDFSLRNKLADQGKVLIEGIRIAAKAAQS